MSEEGPSSSSAEPEIIDLTGLDEGSESEDDESSEHSSEESDEDELVIDRNSRSKLYHALASVPEAQLRLILSQLIEQVPEVEYALTREFVSLKRSPEEAELSSKLELCVKCHHEYDVDAEQENEESGCSFHPGMLKPDIDSFADWDEEVHGPIDSDDTRREFPENFMWTCCQEDGLSKGCVRGLHQPANPQKKQRVTGE